MLNSPFKELGRTTCPVCGHQGRCKARSDGAITCFRVRDEFVGDFVRVHANETCAVFLPTAVHQEQQSRHNGYTQRNDMIANGSAHKSSNVEGVETGPPDLDAEWRKYRESTSLDAVTVLANKLGVSREGLFAAGYARGPREDWFAERDATGKVIGIVTRYENGEKRAGRGHRRGLTIPEGFSESTGEILVVEGASDTAALLSMGLRGVGRPSVSGGVELLGELLADASEDIIVIGENDLKDTGQWPGRDDARRFAQSLANRLGRTVAFIMPPEGVKDVRELLRSLGNPAKAREELLAMPGEVIAPKSPVNEATAAEAKPQSFRLTELWFARRIVKLHGCDLRHCPALGWLVWDGRRWSRDATGEVQRRTKDTIRRLYDEARDLPDDEAGREKRLKLLTFLATCETHRKIENAIALASTEPQVAISADAFDRDPWALNVANGTIDLRTGELRQHRREDLCTKLAPVEYDPDANAPLWASFLRRVLDENDGLIDFAQRSIGYALTGVIREHVLHILWGVGANGKSTFTSTILAMLGDYGCTLPAGLLIRRRQEQHPTERMELWGRRFAASMELGDGARLNEEAVKELTGGDRVKGRFLFKDFMEFAPTAKIAIGTNHRPEVRGTDLGIWRRVRLWPFTVVIPEGERDPLLGDKLKGELPGILAWAVRGCLAWQQVGLAEPSAVTAATIEYRADQDVVERFLAESTFTAPASRVPVADLYKAYRQWSEDSSEYCLTKRKFGERLVERGFASPTRGTGGQRAWTGIGLVTQVT